MAFAYLDTSIISGIVKKDIGAAELAALEEILLAFRERRVLLMTSKVTLEEINRLSEPHRSEHAAVWETLLEMPVSRERILDVVTGGWGNQWRLRKLKQLLRDENDARQLWQAWRNVADFFVTVDRKTILRFADEIFALCPVRAVSPVTFLQLIGPAPGDA